MLDKVLYSRPARLRFMYFVIREIGVILPVGFHSFGYMQTVAPAFRSAFKRLGDFLFRLFALRP